MKNLLRNEWVTRFSIFSTCFCAPLAGLADATNTAPFILAQPINQIVSVGGNASLVVTAGGTSPLNYQWRFEGENIPSATNATLALSNLRYDQSGFYSVQISNAFGQTNSAKAFLNVTQLRIWGDPFIGDTNMPAGLTNVIAVSAGGSHIAALKDDGTVKVWMANPGYIFSSTAVTNIPKSATNVIAISAGRDHVVALRSNGTVVAWGNFNGGQTNVPPGLSNVVSIAAGSSRSYAVKSDGTVVAWGSQPPLPAELTNIVKISSSVTHNIALRRDGTAIIWPSTIVPTYLTNLTGLSNAIDVSAGAGGNLGLRKDGSVWVSPGSRMLLPTNLSNCVAIAAGSLTGAALKQDGTVTSAGSFGKNPMPNLSNVTAIAIGGVQADFGVALIDDGAPRITLQPYSQIVSRSNVVQLHARAVGVQPMSYQWQLDRENIPGATNASLLITNMQGQHTGGYRMLASNALGSVFSATANLTIPFSTNLAASLNATNLVWDSFSSTSKTEKIWFAQIRETHDGEAAAQSGAISHNQQSQLSTTVTGPGTISFWWKVSSEAGYDHLRFHMDSQGIPFAMISGEVGWEKRTFSIPQGTHVLRWTYSKDGTVNSGRDAGWVDEVVFTQPLPTIIRHPFDKTVFVGATVTIPAYAESSLPMTYQWLKNGTNLPGATSQYLTLTNVTLNDAGNYAIRVSNAVGSVISSNATLTVFVLGVSEPIQILPDGSTILWSRVESELENLDALKVEASTNFLEWMTLPGAPVFTNGLLRFHDTNSKDFPMRFYRIVEH